MVATIDPTKARLYPEIIPEAIAATSSTSGVNVASYAAFQPFAMSIVNVMTSQVPGETIRIDTDAGHGILESPLSVRPARIPVPMDILVEDSMDMWAIGTAQQAAYAFSLRISKLTISEKLKYDITLSEEEKALAQKYEITRKYFAGIIRKVEVPQFKRIIEISKEVTVAAGSQTRVGRLINVKSGEKAVMLGFAVDSSAVKAAFGGPGANDTYLTLNRDVRDTSYVKLDCVAMPFLDTELECYIPAIDRHEVSIESATGITNFPVRYRYGIADLTIMEKIRWGLSLSNEEQQDAQDLNLYDSVAIGVL